VKIKGKIIAVLATLGLLLTMMSAIPVAGATAGTATISGGVTSESIDWFSLTTNYNRVGVTIADADANIATDLGGSCTSGALTFKCEIVGHGGEGTGTGANLGYMYTNTAANRPMVDRNADDIPDAVTVRSLQAGTSFLLSTASASAGTIRLAAATTALSYEREATAAVANATAIAANALTSQLSQPSKIEFRFTGVVAGDVLTAPGITIIGKKINPSTMVVETTDSTTQLGSGVNLDTLDNADGANDGNYNLRSADYYSTITSWAMASGAQPKDFSIVEIETVAIGYQYDVRDTITGKVTITSTSAPSAVAIDVLEANTVAGKASSSFTQSVALTSDISLNGVLCTQAKVDAGADPCAALTEKQLYVTNGDLITISYADASPAATITDTARVDLTAPVITLLSPTDKSDSNVGTPTYSVQVTDAVVADSASAGILDTAIQFKLKDEGGGAGGADVTETRSPVTRGFQVSLLEAAARGEGILSWWVVVADKVGNVPAATVTGTVEAKPYKITFDYTAPTLATAETGYGIKNLGTDTEAQTSNVRTSVKVGFTLGAAGKTYSKIDATTVAVGDFLVAGVAPSSVAVNAAGSAIYLGVAEQATDAKPKVELTGEISDKAGNKRTSGKVDTATDKLNPVLTVAVTPGITKEKVTITVQSSETLNAAPTVTTATNTAFNEQAGTPAVTATGVNSWKAEQTAVASEASKFWIKVLGTDIAANAETLGDLLTAGAADATDIVVFQTDLMAPLATVTPASVEAGDVFLRVVFDEDEGKTDGNSARGDQQATIYTDAYKKVTLTSAKLKNTTAGTEEDVLAGFYTSDNIDFVLAKNLTKDSYSLVLGFTDEALNVGTKTQAITVTARAKTTISLTPGYNYVSLPANATSSAINDIIAAADPVSHVFAYDSSAANPWLTATRDATTGLFVGDVSSIVAGTGYIMKATAFVDLKVDIPTASYNSIPGINTVRGGQWSLIGLANRAGAAVDADSYLTGTQWSVCVTYAPASNSWTTLRPDTTTVTANNLAAKTAYFCYFRADGTIVQQ